MLSSTPNNLGCRRFFEILSFNDFHFFEERCSNLGEESASHPISFFVRKKECRKFVRSTLLDRFAGESFAEILDLVF